MTTIQTFWCCVQARALKEQLPSEAVEAGVRIFARHGQHQRSVTLLQSAPSKESVSLETLQAVFAALLQANEAALSLDLLKACSLISSYAIKPLNRILPVLPVRMEVKLAYSAGHRLEHAWRGG